jgi:hypothetical protein
MKARNPLPFVTPPSNGSRILLEGTKEVLGLFFGSYSRDYHLARYTPYGGGPRDTLCSQYVGILTSSASPEGLTCKICIKNARKIINA